MRRKHEKLPGMILIIVLFFLLAAGNALSRTETEDLVRNQIAAAEKMNRDISFAEALRMIDGFRE